MKPISQELEKDIERKIGEFAKKHGCMYIKFVSPAQRAVPDRLIITPQGVIGFLEVKRAGCKPTTLQTLKMKELTDHGCTVTWCDNVADGKKFVEKLLQGKDFC